MDARKTKARLKNWLTPKVKRAIRSSRRHLLRTLGCDVLIIAENRRLSKELEAPLIKGLEQRGMSSTKLNATPLRELFRINTHDVGPIEPGLIICLGLWPEEFIPPPGIPTAQVVGAGPLKGKGLTATLRSTDFLISLSETTNERLASKGHFKPVTHVRSLNSVPERLFEFVDKLQLKKPSLGQTISSYRHDSPRRIDTFMTTSLRPRFFGQTLKALLEAKRATRHEVRLHVFVDRLDDETLDILKKHIDEVSIVSTNYQLGLPFLYNMILAHQEREEIRSERFADYICYIQDDCLISAPELYFDFMVRAYEEVLPAQQVGYVSGFYCSLHPGFELRDYRDKKVLLSDSIDGKNFLAPPTLIRKVGPLGWYFPNGKRRGNPGPGKLGSHFDLWQWKESPTSLMEQERVSIIIPGLCRHIAETAEDSTWGNATTEETKLARRSQGRLYNTRGVIPEVDENQF